MVHHEVMCTTGRTGQVPWGGIPVAVAVLLPVVVGMTPEDTYLSVYRLVWSLLVCASQLAWWVEIYLYFFVNVPSSLRVLYGTASLIHV